tara:strand:- start:1979 stop:2317 length:339 start_codon:yes stop_codon:yes gene_type:complete
MTGTLDFELLDDHRVPPTIKPMIKLHDLLVKGWRRDKEVKLPKLISKMEKGISEQVEEMVKIENQTQFVSLRLVEVLNSIRKLIDEPTDDNIREALIKLLDKSCDKLEKKYK